MLKKILCITSALLLSGCLAETKPMNWYKAGVTPQQFSADKAQCLYEIEMRGAPRDMTNLFTLCMYGKGYSQ